MSLDTYVKFIQDTLTLLREEPLVLASLEDAKYFRMLSQRRPLPSSSPHPQEISIPPILNLSIPLSQPTLIQEPDLPAPVSPTKLETESENNPILLPQKIAETIPKTPEKWHNHAQLPSEEINFSALRPLFKKIAPNIAIIDDIPDDTMAKKIAARWRAKNQTAPISILCFSEPEKQKMLLEEITKAIDIYFGPARLIPAAPIEKEKQWEAFLSSTDLKLVIACDYTIWQLSDLMRHYKEIPSQQTRTLGNVPLFLLPDLSLYLKDPLLKRSLWKAICQILSS